MQLTLQPLATACCVSGRPFAEHDRVVCYLVREVNGLTVRRDVLATEDRNLPKPEETYCRWIIFYNPRLANGNNERNLKVAGENLFLTLADPDNPESEANTQLLQFLALMLERKRLLKPRGLTADRARQILEHVPSHQLYEIPVGNLDQKFFLKIQDQLGSLGLAPKNKLKPTAAETLAVNS